jgi:FkbM family methyltransferase
MSLLRNAWTVVAHPSIAIEYAAWAAQRSFTEHGPLRTVGGVRIGNFNGFSEYHSVVRGVSNAELAFLRGYDFPSGAILDVGANLGLFSLVMSRRYPDRRIVAFEPAPSTFAALVANASLNDAKNVECHRVGVAAHDGTATFALRENARANSSLSRGAQNAAGIEIMCTTLDRFVALAGINQIALLKVDVEGFEADVFRGAREVLARMRPGVAYFEVCPALARKEGFAADEAAAILEDAGYALHRIGPDGSLSRSTRKETSAIALENWVALSL